ncbi:unnamed protein product [Bursaphelenchus xylophilus]|uniref:Mitochondrial inner membrane protein Mpv17 n=1 Tax=Bursaphelenchus xylophilus TaxID=6326 RepID=A0A1I7SA48_BURXY|nr:unnamed protein product [Bursaphelenchus xylophilus]CAG9131813.1 unnamed protein product [Bursaphelenchus xylophilus]
MLSAYLRLMARRPLATQIVSAGVIGVAGDAVCQLAIERKPLKQYDYGRGARFFIMPAFWMAPILNRWFRVLEMIGGKGAIFKRLAVDQILFSPCFGASILMVLGIMEGATPQQAFDSMKKIIWDIYVTSLQFWPAVQLINLNFVPLNYRVVFVQLASLIWNSYISYKTQNKTLQ